MQQNRNIRNLEKITNNQLWLYVKFYFISLNKY